VVNSSFTWWEGSEDAETLHLDDVLRRASRCFTAGHQDTRLDVAPRGGLGQVGAAEQESAAVCDRELGVLA
jgi:hypothetical protein